MFDICKWGRGKRFLNMNARKEANDNKALDILTKPKVAKIPNGLLHDLIGKGQEKVRHLDWRLDAVKPDYEGRSPFDDGRCFGHFLQRKGFLYVGSGAYSTIFGKPDSDKVWKVSQRIDPWFEFVKWAYENGHEAFAPKVYSYKYFPGKPEENGRTRPFYVAIVDRLTYCNRNDGHKHVLTGALFDLLSGREEVHPDIKAVSELLAPGLPKFAQDFREKFKKGPYSLDYWGPNQMLSSDMSRWVMNDPLCGVPANDNEVKVRWKLAA